MTNRLKQNLDQFYTKKEIVQRCLKIIDLTVYDKVIEPSAGNGAFFDFLPTHTKVGLDLDPQHPDIKKQDFFDFFIKNEEVENVLEFRPYYARKRKRVAEGQLTEDKKIKRLFKKWRRDLY